MGKQEPSVRICPDYVDTDGRDAAKVLECGDLYPDPWQETVLNDWMGRNEAGTWSAPACGMSVPRQNGKTCDTVGRIAAGMILFNEWHIYTAQLQKTATETFMELKGLFESKALSRYVKDIKSALGREQVILKNGARCQFVARTRNGGRGLHGDCLTFDEAQELDDSQLASFLPCLAASKNPQTIYIGTPPTPESAGDVFRRIRDDAKSGKSKNTAWTEFSVDEIGDVTDRKRWALTNPALGRRIRESTIVTECEQMDPDTFARERLGWWSPIIVEKIDFAINHSAWEKCKSKELKPDGKTAYGVKFTADGSEVVLCGAVCPKNGGPARISLINRQSTTRGVQWLADWLNQRVKKAACVVIDGRNGVDILINRISETWKYKDSIIRSTPSNVIAAASQLINAVNENSLTWYYGQEDLNDSAVTSIKRHIGGGFGFGGENSAPIEAAALALWGAKTSKRDPSRRMRIG